MKVSAGLKFRVPFPWTLLAKNKMKTFNTDLSSVINVDGKGLKSQFMWVSTVDSHKQAKNKLKKQTPTQC